MGEGRPPSTGVREPARDEPVGAHAGSQSSGRWAPPVRLHDDPANWVAASVCFAQGSSAKAAHVATSGRSTDAGPDQMAEIQALSLTVARLEAQNGVLLAEVAGLRQDFKSLYALLDARLPQHALMRPGQAPSLPSASRRWQWSRLHAAA